MGLFSKKMKQEHETMLQAEWIAEGLQYQSSLDMNVDGNLDRFFSGVPSRELVRTQPHAGRN